MGIVWRNLNISGYILNWLSITISFIGLNCLMNQCCSRGFLLSNRVKSEGSSTFASFFIPKSFLHSTSIGHIAKIIKSGKSPKNFIITHHTYMACLGVPKMQIEKLFYWSCCFIMLKSHPFKKETSSLTHATTDECDKNI